VDRLRDEDPGAVAEAGTDGAQLAGETGEQGDPGEAAQSEDTRAAETAAGSLEGESDTMEKSDLTS
jgi:hypothetical protein